jgi:hypothetical protein
MDGLTQLLDADVLPILIPIIALIGYFSLKGARSYFRHVERMEKIRNGMDPDANSEDL